MLPVPPMTSSRAARDSRTTPAPPRALRLGERVRQLRVAAGLTQTDLAGDRFSKEYISQIERGKTRPTTETVEWLALRLGVDAGFLASGVSTDERAKAEAILARAESLYEDYQLDASIEEYANALPRAFASCSDSASSRARSTSSRAASKSRWRR